MYLPDCCFHFFIYSEAPGLIKRPVRTSAHPPKLFLNNCLGRLIGHLRYL